MLKIAVPYSPPRVHSVAASRRRFNSGSFFASVVGGSGCTGSVGAGVASSGVADGVATGLADGVVAGFVLAFAAGVALALAAGAAVGAVAAVATTFLAFVTFTFKVSFVVFLPTFTFTVTFVDFPAFLPVTLNAVFPAFFTVAIFLFLLFTVSFFTFLAFTFLIVTFLVAPLATEMDLLESLIFLAASASVEATPTIDTVKATAITFAKVLLKFFFKTLTSIFIYLIISPKVPPPCLGGREDLTGARYYTGIVLKTKDYYYRIILQPLLLLLFSLSQT